MIWLVGGFFVTALLYAAVGFGGGSTYSALMALAGVDYRILPLISLACNIVVVAGSTIRFARAGVTPWRGAILLTALAAPAAMLGGLTPIDKTSFLTLLGEVCSLRASPCCYRSPRPLMTSQPDLRAGCPLSRLLSVIWPGWWVSVGEYSLPRCCI